jgi:ABC-2 type transport system permease protein
MHRISVILLKEWRESLRNKMILFGAIFLPLFMVGAATMMVYQGREIDVPGAQIALFNMALMYFLILPAVIPLAIAAYSIIGEKEQGRRSKEAWNRSSPRRSPTSNSSWGRRWQVSSPRLS